MFVTQPAKRQPVSRKLYYAIYKTQDGLEFHVGRKILEVARRESLSQSIPSASPLREMVLSDWRRQVRIYRMAKVADESES
jgi:hypothetical protein